MTILQHAIAQAATSSSYQIARSLRFNSADTAYLNRTPASAGNRRTWTWSQWFKFGLISSANYRSFIEAFTGSTDVYNSIAYENGVIKVNQDNGAGGVMLVSTPAVFRDPGAWYHLLVAVDTTQATGTNRVKMWINGVQQTLTFTTTPSQNLDTWINSANAHRIGARWGTVSSAACFDGYMTDINFIDGQALDPTSFGQTDSATGVWVPKAYTGTFGTNGFWLKFDDNSNNTATTLGKDSSGNGNNWTPNNFSVTAGAGNDSLVDSPTNYGTDTGAGGEVRGNYCTMNPLIQGSSLANGNLDQAASTVVNFGTMGVSTGKWYYEATITAQPTGGLKIGVGAAGTASEIGQGADGWAIICQSNANNGQVVNNGTLGTDYTNFAVNDVVMVAFDMDSGKLYFGKNGTWLNSAVPASGTGAVYTNLSGTLFPASTAQTGGAFTWNFGQRAFAYTAPSGFKALCTQNLPTPAIGASASTLASKNFDILTYTGNGATRTLSGLGFQPDISWIKSRSAAYDHRVWDAVRGAGQKGLYTDLTSAEGTSDQYGYISAFTSDGFTVTSGSTSIVGVNENTTTYAAWNWKANGAGSSNTAGSITSTVSANQTAGISIVTYTGTGTGGATVGHGLGAVPRMIITKARVATGLNWAVYHASLGATKNLWLSNADAVNTQTVIWNDTAPSSTVFTVGSAGNTNSTQGMVAYCFAEVAGFSKFGTYTGNGSTDGPFIYCGFRPKFILVKNTNVAYDWKMWDSVRDPYNVGIRPFWANLVNAEGNAFTTGVDFLSNGVKIRSNDAIENNSGSTYIFMAFAENPFNYSRAR